MLVSILEVNNCALKDKNMSKDFQILFECILKSFGLLSRFGYEGRI